MTLPFKIFLMGIATLVLLVFCAAQGVHALEVGPETTTAPVFVVDESNGMMAVALREVYAPAGTVACFTAVSRETITCLVPVGRRGDVVLLDRLVTKRAPAKEAS